MYVSRVCIHTLCMCHPMYVSPDTMTLDMCHTMHVSRLRMHTLCECHPMYVSPYTMTFNMPHYIRVMRTHAYTEYVPPYVCATLCMCHPMYVPPYVCVTLHYNTMYRVAKTHRMPSIAGHLCKRAINYRALLQRMTCIVEASCGSSPPCMCHYVCVTRHLSLYIYIHPVFHELWSVQRAIYGVRSLSCIAVCCRALLCVAVHSRALQCVAVCCSALQCVAVCCSVSQCVAVCCSVLQCVAVCCSVLQCVAVCR